METVQEPPIQEMARRIKEAVLNNRVHEVEHLPREAFVQAAWEGIAHYHREMITYGKTLKINQFELEKDARLDLLTEDERERAISLANHWLDEHFDQ